MNFILYMMLLGLVTFLAIWVKTLSDRITLLENDLIELTEVPQDE